VSIVGLWLKKTRLNVIKLILKRDYLTSYHFINICLFATWATQNSKRQNSTKTTVQ